MLVLEVFIEQATQIARSGSVVLEEILKEYRQTFSGDESVWCVQEMIAVGALYIRWQRREVVNGGKVAPAESIAFAIQAISVNYAKASHNQPWYDERRLHGILIN